MEWLPTIGSIIIAAIAAWSAVKLAQINKSVNLVQTNTNSIATHARETAEKTLATAVATEKMLGEALASVALLKGLTQGRADEKADQALRNTIPVVVPAIATIPVAVVPEPPAEVTPVPAPT